MKQMTILYKGGFYSMYTEALYSCFYSTTFSFCLRDVFLFFTAKCRQNICFGVLKCCGPHKVVSLYVVLCWFVVLPLLFVC